MSQPLDLPARGRTWLPLTVAGVAVVGVLSVVLLRAEPLTCAEKVPAKSPLLSPAQMIEQPDPRLDTLVSSVNNWTAPFGPVRAGVGYDYDQWLHLYGLADGLLTLTKNNARMTLVDDRTLRARWSMVPAAKRTAWDASTEAFLLLDLVKDQPTRVGSFSLATGEQRWCREVRASHTDGQPVATMVLGEGDVVVALPKDDGLEATRLRAEDGRFEWSESLEGVGRGDYLGPLDDQSFVLGGVEEHRLVEPPAEGSSDISAFANEDGRRSWTWSGPAGTVAHVVGVSNGSVLLVTVASGRSALKALAADGTEMWSVEPRDNAFQSTLRGDVVLMRSQVGLDGYDAATGKQLWHLDIPTEPTYFPYGFTLSQMPSLDETHVLMPTTTALRILDVTTGQSTAQYPLPTDGINTTYWPYQLAVSPGLIGVVTNTGGVVADRE